MLKSLLILSSLFLAVGLTVFAWFAFKFFKAWNGDGYTAVNKAVSDQYYTKENQLYFVSMGNLFSLGAKKIEGADISSFQILTTEYARDLQHIYFNGKVVDSVDLESFRYCPGFTPKIRIQYTYWEKVNLVLISRRLRFLAIATMPKIKIRFGISMTW